MVRILPEKMGTSECPTRHTELFTELYFLAEINLNQTVKRIVGR